MSCRFELIIDFFPVFGEILKHPVLIGNAGSSTVCRDDFVFWAT